MCYHPFFFPWGWIVFLAIVFFIFIRRPWHHRHWWRGGPPRWHGNPWERSPEDILAERFAKGEIDEKEYNERLAVLKGRRI